ncbi:MAG: leucine-rich repeat protein [Oscillospiraceae bacterium]|nr:leucine-rich repeat protein [Oscillospiraceae bacterium]
MRNINSAAYNKFISCLLVIAMLFSMLPSYAFAAKTSEETYQIGESVYAELSENGELAVSGSGDTYDYSPETPAPWYAERTQILSVQIEDGITSIGDYLFYNCENLTGKLTLPTSLISIGEGAFSGNSFETAPKLRAIINEFNGAEVAISEDIYEITPDTEPITDPPAQPEAPEAVDPSNSYEVDPDTEIIEPDPVQDADSEEDGEQADLDEPLVNESDVEAPIADSSSEDGTPVEDTMLETQSASEPDEIIIEDAQTPLAGDFIDSGAEESELPSERSDDASVPADDADEPTEFVTEPSEMLPDESVEEPTDEPLDEAVNEEPPATPTDALNSAVPESIVSSPTVGTSSVPHEPVFITEQAIGANAFYAGQSGAFYCSDENGIFISVMEAAGYVRATGLVPVTYADEIGNDYDTLGLLTEYGLLLEDFCAPLQLPEGDALHVYTFTGWRVSIEVESTDVETPLTEEPAPDEVAVTEQTTALPQESVQYGAWSFAPYEETASRFSACFELTARPLSERTLEQEIDGQRISVTGKLPENAVLSAEAIALGEAEEIVSGHLASGARTTVHFAYDITILVDGVKYQPADYGESVRVRIENAPLPENGGSLSVLHVKDDDTAENLAVESATEAAVEFTADSFSPIIGYSLTTTVWDGTADTTWYDPNRTSFTITTAEQLAGLAVIVNGTYLNNANYVDANSDQFISAVSFSGKTVTLGADIVLNEGELTSSSRQWTPIGTATSTFSGTFDGAGHTISGLYINSTAGNQGLFGHVTAGTVQNLAVSGSVTSTGSYIAGVVGWLASPSHIRNCSYAGSVSGSGYVGGVAGIIVSSSSDVKNCYNSASVSGNDSVGGIAAQTWGGTVSNSYNIGSVTCSGLVKGGVVGNNTGTTSYSYFLKTDMINAELNATNANGGQTSLGCFTGSDGELTKNEYHNNTNLAYGTNLLEALNGWVYAQNNTKFWMWRIVPGENGGYPVLSDAAYSPGSWVYSGNYDTRWYHSAATGATSFAIETPEQLAGLAHIVNGTAYRTSYSNGVHKPTTTAIPQDTFVGKTITLGADIVLNDGDISRQWTPIGEYATDSSNVFSGTFDGAGHTVSGLYIDSAATNNRGLFGYVSAGTVRTLTVRGDVIGRTNVGIITGTNTGSIINCASSGNVTGVGAADGVGVHVAGIAGSNSTDGAIINCFSTANATGHAGVGGIAGLNYQSTIRNCYSTGIPTSSIAAEKGGIVGVNNNSVIEACYFLKAGVNSSLKLRGYDVGSVAVSYSGYFTSNVGTLFDTTTFGTNLLAALNAWVDEQDDDTLMHWATLSGQNSGYPVFVNLAPKPGFEGDEIYYKDGDYYPTEADALAETNALGPFSTMQELLDGIDKDVIIHMMSGYTVSGTETINGGSVYAVTLLRHGTYTADSLVTVSAGADLTLANITLDGGAVWTGAVDATLGRGTVNSGVTAATSLVVVSGSLTLDNGATVQNNDNQTSNGGGLTGAAGSSIRITGGSVYNCVTKVEPNGAAYTGNDGGGISSSGAVAIEAGKLSGNYGTHGGGIYCYTSTNMTGGEISGNKAAYGGGLNVGNVHLDGGEVKGNSALLNGGGIVLGGNSRIAGCKITGNKAQTGGGIYTWYPMSLEITGGEISNNIATYGSGIQFIPSSDTSTPAIAISGGSILNNTIHIKDSTKVTLTVTGGTVESITGGAPTNGTANGNAPVYLNTITLSGVNAQTAVTQITQNLSYPYGCGDAYTDAEGKLYFWMPLKNDKDANTVTSWVHTVDTHYSGAITPTADNLATETFTANHVYVNGSLTTGNNDGSSAANAYRSFATALTKAETFAGTSGSATIVVCGPTEISEKQTIAANILITSVVGGTDYRKGTSNATTPNAGAKLMRVNEYKGYLLEVTGTLTLSNLTVDGGAVWVDGKAFTVNADGLAVISANTGIEATAALLHNTASGQLTVQAGTVLENNHNKNGANGGGAIYDEAETDVSRLVFMTGGVIRNNAATANSYSNTAGKGGAIYTKGSVYLVDGELSGNVAQYHGGGIFIINEGNIETQLWMQGGAVSGNAVLHQEADHGGGAGVCVAGGSDGQRAHMFMEGGVISGNHSNGNGGGLRVFATAHRMDMFGGEISGNTAKLTGSAIQLNGRLDYYGGTISGADSGDGSCIHTDKHGTNGSVLTIKPGAVVDIRGEIHLGECTTTSNQTLPISVESSFTVSPDAGRLLLDISTLASGTELVKYISATALDTNAKINAEALKFRLISGGWALAKGGGDTANSLVLASGADGIYLNGQNGSDDNNGSTPLLAVKTVAKAQGLALAGKPIYICGQVDIIGEQTLTGGYTYLRYAKPTNQAEWPESYTGVLFRAAGSGAALTVADTIIDGNRYSVTAQDSIIEVAMDATLNIRPGAQLVNNNNDGTLEGGSSDGTSVTYTNGCGGAVTLDGHMYMTGGRISGNTAGWSGGGVYVLPESTLELSGGEISGNTAAVWEKDANGTNVFTGFGGGVYSLGTVIMSGGSVSGNALEYPGWYGTGSGAGVHIAEGGDMTMSGGRVSKNRTMQYGAGVSVWNDARFELIGGSISANSSVNSGGGVYTRTSSASRSAGLFSMTGGTISGNTATASGGGVSCQGTVRLAGTSLITNNTADSGGGVFTNGGNVTMEGGEISGNTATKSGGGVYTHTVGTFTLLGGTISDNTATISGGGVFSNASFALSGGTISGNTAYEGGGVYSSATFTMTGGEISGNISQKTGGGILLSSGSNFTLNAGRISNNRAIGISDGRYGQGGGIFGWGTITITGGEISGNWAKLDGGGVTAVYTMSVTGGIISGNTTPGYGGGICGIANASLTIAGETLITGNTAGSGGGVSANYNSKIFISGGRISGNTADRGGGALATMIGSITISGGEVSGNTATLGGGVCGVITSGSESPFHTIIISGGSIINNTATTAGNSIYNPKELTLSGSPLIQGDVHLVHDGSAKVDVSGGGFLPAAPIQITRPGAVAGAVIVKYYSGGAETEAPADDLVKFYMTNPALRLVKANDDDTVFEIDATSNVQYVLSTGDDNATGTTPDAPVNTLAKAYQNLASGGGTIYVMSAMTISGTQSLSGTVYDNGTAYTITDGTVNIVRYVGSAPASYKGTLFSIASGGTLTLSDIIIDGNRQIVVAAPLISVSSGGRLNITDGAVLRNNRNTESREVDFGGGVGVKPGGIAVMTGGTITGNYSTRGGGVTVNSKGAGQEPGFTMNGGVISGNLSLYGGGVAVYGTFTLTGDGKIAGNKAAGETTGDGSGGGGVHVGQNSTNSTGNPPVFNMSGGTVSSNIAPNGGGVYLFHPSALANISGGQIEANVSDYGSAAQCVASSGQVLTITGGTISGEGTVDGSCIKAQSCTLNISGSPAINNAVYLTGSDQIINVPAEYTGAPIPVNGDGFLPGRVIATYEGSLPTSATLFTADGYTMEAVGQDVRIESGVLSGAVTAAGEGISLGAGQSRSVTLDLAGLFTTGEALYITGVTANGADGVTGFALRPYDEVLQNRRNWGSADSNTKFGLSAALTGGETMDAYAESGMIPLGAMTANGQLTFTVYSANTITQGGPAGTFTVAVSNGTTSCDVEVSVNRRPGGILSVTVPLQVTGVMNVAGDFDFPGTAEYAIRNYSTVPVAVESVAWAWNTAGTVNATTMFADYTKLTGIVKFGGQSYRFNGAAPNAATPTINNTIRAANGILPGVMELGWGMELGENNYMKSIEQANVATITYTIGAASN